MVDRSSRLEGLRAARKPSEVRRDATPKRSLILFEDFFLDQRREDFGCSGNFREARHGRRREIDEGLLLGEKVAPESVVKVHWDRVAPEGLSAILQGSPAGYDFAVSVNPLHRLLLRFGDPRRVGHAAEDSNNNV
jgi:hypothetical protein